MYPEQDGTNAWNRRRFSVPHLTLLCELTFSAKEVSGYLAPTSASEQNQLENDARIAAARLKVASPASELGRQVRRLRGPWAGPRVSSEPLSTPIFTLGSVLGQLLTLERAWGCIVAYGPCSRQMMMLGDAGRQRGQVDTSLHTEQRMAEQAAKASAAREKAKDKERAARASKKGAADSSGANVCQWQYDAAVSLVNEAWTKERLNGEVGEGSVPDAPGKEAATMKPLKMPDNAESAEQPQRTRSRFDDTKSNFQFYSGEPLRETGQPLKEDTVATAAKFVAVSPVQAAPTRTRWDRSSIGLVADPSGKEPRAAGDAAENEEKLPRKNARDVKAVDSPDSSLGAPSSVRKRFEENSSKFEFYSGANAATTDGEKMVPKKLAATAEPAPRSSKPEFNKSNFELWDFSEDRPLREPKAKKTARQVVPPTLDENKRRDRNSFELRDFRYERPQQEKKTLEAEATPIEAVQPTNSRKLMDENKSSFAFHDGAKINKAPAALEVQPASAQLKEVDDGSHEEGEEIDEGPTEYARFKDEDGDSYEEGKEIDEGPTENKPMGVGS